jgi:predicted GIY-YIG superfamily endonuclease
VAAGQQFLFAPAKPLVRRLGRKFFRRIPTDPGVYFMRDAADKVVYVGKAGNLRQRLRNYRVANPERMPRRHLRMLHQVERIEFQPCATEAAALKQEKKWIRSLKPKYNRAGVWPAKTQFLSWRFAGQAVQFAVQEVPPLGWERFGPLGGYAPHLLGSLARLLWLALNPQAGFSQLPLGWAQGRLSSPASIACGGRADEIRRALGRLFWGQPAEFLAWVLASVGKSLAAFESAALRADLEEIESFAARYREGRNPDRQMALL